MQSMVEGLGGGNGLLHAVKDISLKKDFLQAVPLVNKNNKPVPSIVCVFENWLLAILFLLSRGTKNINKFTHIWKITKRRKKNHILTTTRSSFSIESTVKVYCGGIVTWASEYHADCSTWRLWTKGGKDVKVDEGKSVIMPGVCLCVLEVRCSCRGLFRERSTLWYAWITSVCSGPGLQADLWKDTASVSVFWGFFFFGAVLVKIFALVLRG